MSSKSIEAIDLHGNDYLEALEIQKKYYQESSEGGKIRVLFHEPMPVFTLGKRECTADLKVPLDFLKQKGAQILQTDRGGSITFHGPGQIVGFPMLNLTEIYGSSRSIRNFVYDLEECLIMTLLDFDLLPERKEKKPGVWIKDQKIASLGLSIHAGQVFHGFSLNHSTDLDWFSWIHSCGITDCQVTSMKKVFSDHGASNLPTWNQVVKEILKKMGEFWLS